MSVQIGEFLFEIRKEINVSAKDICGGICKLPTYSFYENGKRNPDYLTLNLFLERMGHGITGLIAYVTKIEMEYLSWRQKVSRVLRERRWEELEEYIQNEPCECNSLNEGIRQQYSLFLQAVRAEMVENNIDRAISLYEKALECTCPFLIMGEIGSPRVGVIELLYYGLYLRLLGKKKPSKKKEITRKLESALKYLEEKIGDCEERVNAYPHLVCIWMELAEGERFNRKKELYLRKSLELLKRERKMYHVTEVLRRLITGREEGGQDCSKERQAYYAISHLYKFFGKQTMFNPYEFSENMWMFTILGEYLGKNRKRKNLTQESVSENICATESYSRIEQGKRAPNQKNYRVLTERLGIEPRYVLELVNTGSYRAVMLRKEIDEALFYNKYEKARELLGELETLLDERGEKENNFQYLEAQYTACAYGMQEITDQQREGELKRILAYTLDMDDIGKNIHIYTRQEIMIINQLAGAAKTKKEYNEGIGLLNNFLKDMEQGIDDIEQRFRETYLAALNLDKLLTDIECYKEGNELCMKWGRMAVHRGWATLIDNYVVEISYNLRNMGGYSEEYTRQLCQTALELSEMYGTKEDQLQIYNYLQSIL